MLCDFSWACMNIIFIQIRRWSHVKETKSPSLAYGPVNLLGLLTKWQWGLSYIRIGGSKAAASLESPLSIGKSCIPGLLHSPPTTLSWLSFKVSSAQWLLLLTYLVEGPVVLVSFRSLLRFVDFCLLPELQEERATQPVSWFLCVVCSTGSCVEWRFLDGGDGERFRN